MVINGKEIHFSFAVRAQLQIAALCADHKLQNIEKLFTEGPDEERALGVFNTGKIMNNVYEQIKRHRAGEPVDWDADYSLFTYDDFLNFEKEEESEFEKELISVMYSGNKRNVEAQAPKGKKNEKDQESR